MFVCTLSLEEELELFKKYKSKYKVENDTKVNMYIKNSVEECNKIFGSINKLDILRKLYSYLVVNVYFIENDPRFCETAKNKLKEFYKLNKWQAASEIYYFYLFGETIEGNKYNFESKDKNNINIQTNHISFKTVVPDKFEDLFYSN